LAAFFQIIIAQMVWEPSAITLFKSPKFHLNDLSILASLF
jgi:hypothetical protein